MRKLGALVRPRAAECSFNWVFSIKKKERPTTGIRRGSARDPPGTRRGSHFWGPCPLGCSLSRLIEGTRTADGTWEITGSNTPWAQGPANCPLPTPAFRVFCRKGVIHWFAFDGSDRLSPDPVHELSTTLLNAPTHRKGPSTPSR